MRYCTHPVTQYGGWLVISMALLLATAQAQTEPATPPPAPTQQPVSAPAQTPSQDSAVQPVIEQAATELTTKATDKGKGAAKEKETIVDSDTFKLDLNGHIGVFSGHVHVVDPSFELTADEMTLFFDKDNKIQRMLARGNVFIKQSDTQSATSQQAEYTVVDKKLKLTGNPVVQQKDNKVTGTIIYLYPGSDRMDVEGRSKVRFYSNEKQNGS